MTVLVQKLCVYRLWLCVSLIYWYEIGLLSRRNPFRLFSDIHKMSDLEKQSQVADSLDDCKMDSNRDIALSYTSSTIDEHAHDSSSSENSEGGAKAYLTVFGAFLALFCTFGQMNAFGTFQAWYTTHQLSTLHASTISWIGSLQLWVFFFSV